MKREASVATAAHLQVAVLTAEGEQLSQALVPFALGCAPVWPPVHSKCRKLAFPFQ